MFETARIQENIKYSILKDTFGLCNHMGGIQLGEKIEYIITACVIMQILGRGGDSPFQRAAVIQIFCF